MQNSKSNILHAHDGKQEPSLDSPCRRDYDSLTCTGALGDLWQIINLGPLLDVEKSSGTRDTTRGVGHVRELIEDSA